MEELFSNDKALRFGSLVEKWISENVLTAWAASQLALVMVSLMAALIARRLVRPRIESCVDNFQVSPRLRQMVRNGSGLIGSLFLLLILFAIHAVLRMRYAQAGVDVIRLAMSLTTAWILVRFLTVAMADQRTARVIGWFIWGLAALDILGLLDPITLALDSVGMSVGSSRITLLTVTKGFLLLATLLWGALFAASLLSQRMQASSALTPRTQVLITKLAKFALIAFAIVLSLSTVGINLAALALFAGALGVGIGIGLQHQVSNLISGLFLLLDKSIKPGDVIEVGESYGWVREMGARYVGLVTRDNKEILIPNDAFVLNQVVNWSHSDRRVRLEVKFGVSYSSDPHHIRKLAIAAAQGAKRISPEPPPVCHLTAFGDSSVDFVLRFWISDPENGVTNIKGEVYLALWDAFKVNKIDIPYPHRVVIMPGEPETKLAARENI
ncbi:MAG: mechanosensitive ion channel [Rhodospirillaceae bacterium]|nr:mechanosensitive ion channel [Rhodospirillaceae bacterium]